jgi:ribonuclease T2
LTIASLLRSAAVALALAGSAAAVLAANPLVDRFILALSWSPSFCASSDAGRQPLQCGAGRRFAFVVHGLWPQYRAGQRQFCRTAETWIPEDQIAEMLPIMPSKRLIIHQWRKHGTCTALSMEDYFDFTRTLFGKIRIPARYLLPSDPVTTTPHAIIADFIKTNRGLAPDMIEIVCTSKKKPARLTELRICFSAAGRFAQCSPRAGDNCQAETLVLPPVRGMRYPQQ